MFNTIHIEGSSTAEVMADLANHLGSTVIKKNQEFLCPIPQNIGSGFIKASDFPNDINVIEISGIFKRKMFFMINKTEDYLVKLIFNLSATVNYFAKKDDPIPLDRFDSVLHAFSKFNFSLFEIPDNVPISIYMLNIQEQFFTKRLEVIRPDAESGIDNFIQEIKEKNDLLSKSSFTLKLHGLIQNFLLNDYAGSMRFIYQEAKTNEIIIERIKQHFDDSDEQKRTTILRKSTIKSIEKAASFISEHLDSLETIKDLAANVGLTPQTLQLGFKYQFGCSVNTYILNIKLKRAAELLENTNLNISEITYEIGINSKSYFAKIFHERYGINPSEYRKHLKDSKNINEASKRQK